MTTTTPNMNLVLPDVSITAGPQWATLLNAAYALIDSHDHTSGKGVQITPAGMNISSDLSFVQNNATNLRSVRLYPNNTFTPTVNDRTCLYSLGGELYYIDGSGNNVQLTINGTVDVANSITALSIKDSGFFIQYFGDTSRQFRFNVSAIPASTTRILSVPDSGSNDTFVTQAATQTLTNKTITTPTISSPAIQNFANFTTSAAPIAPASGTADIYVSSVDGQLHLLNSAGVDTPIGASGAGGKNYLQTYYGFSLSPLTGAAVSLTTSGNRTTNQTVFGVSTPAASTLITYNTSTPLRAPGDLQMTFPSSGAAAFVESPMFMLDLTDANTSTQYISFDSSFLTSGAAVGDVTVSIIQYDSSGNYVGVINPTVTNLPTGYFKYKAAFNPSSTATAKYSLRFTVTTTSARTVDVQNIVVGPQYVTQSDAIGAWQSYTPTFSAGFGTPSGVNVRYRRVGDSVEVSGSFTMGTVAASAGTISLPAGLSIDTTKINSSGFRQRLGIYNRLNSASTGAFTNGLAGVLVYNGSSTTSLTTSSATTGDQATFTNQNVSDVFGSSDSISIQFIVPISQWTASVTLAGNPNIEYVSNTSSTDADDTTSFATGSTGSVGVVRTTTLTTTRKKRVQFSSPVQPTDRVILEIYHPTVGTWFPVANALVYASGATNLSLTSMPLLTGTAIFGMGLQGVSTTQVDVVFGQYATSTNSANVDWSNTSILSGTRWRVAKYSAVGLAEIAPATQTTQGTITRESQWTAYTPTFSAGFGTVTSASAFYKVVGDSLFIRGSCAVGSVAASLGSISLPSGFTIASSKLSISGNTTSAAGVLIGGFATASGTGNQAGPVVTAPGTSTTLIYTGNQYANTNHLIPTNVSTAISSASTFSFNIEVPIV